MNFAELCGRPLDKRCFSFSHLGHAADCNYDVHLRLQGIHFRVHSAGLLDLRALAWGLSAKEYLRAGF